MVIKQAPEPVSANDAPFQFNPLPDANPAPTPDSVITAVFAVIVVLPVLAPPAFQAVPTVVTVIALDPRVNVLVFVLLILNAPQEHGSLLVFRAPVVSATVPPTVDPLVVCVNVISDLLIVMLAAVPPPVTIVTVAAVPELESNVTSSEDVGTAAPPAPPEVVDQ
jgi:hypothetical protein